MIDFSKHDITIDMDYFREAAREYLKDVDDRPYANTNMKTSYVAKRFVEDFLDYVQQGLDASD